MYNLLARNIELEVIPAALSHGIGIVPWSPLAGGLLGGVLGKKHDGKRRLADGAVRRLAKHRDAIEKYEDLAAELGHEPGEIGLAWLLHQPAVTAPIIGPRTQGQLDAAVRALDITLDLDALGRLDAIFPGRRPAPEDYAW